MDKELICEGVIITCTVQQVTSCHYLGDLICDMHILHDHMLIHRMTFTLGHDSNSVVNQHKVVGLNNVSVMHHETIVKVSPGIEFLDVDTAMLDPVPVVEVDAMLRCVNLVV